jgi:hypothetical protein
MGFIYPNILLASQDDVQFIGKGKPNEVLTAS